MPDEKQKLFSSLEKNIGYIYELNSKNTDITVKRFKLCGTCGAIVICEGLTSKDFIGESVLKPMLMNENMPEEAREQLVYLRDRALCVSEQDEVGDFDTLILQLMSGFCIILLDGTDAALAVDAKGYEKRSISDPITEIVDRGSRESFVETAKVNMSMIRRRLKTTDLRFESMEIGEKSATTVIMCYLSGRAESGIIKEVRSRLKSIKLDNVLESGYLAPFLDTDKLSFFSAVGYTERPDTLCAKISEGRIGIIVDGAPLSLIVPYLFSENFQSFDDYCNRPYYAAFVRFIKYFAFFVSIILPGFYVAVGTFHPEILPESLMYDIAASESRTPFSIAAEAFIIHLIYEILHQAGLRLPKPVGNTISIVGALVIGESAVTAGIISAPMVMVVAFTAISTFLVPSLYNSSAVLRLVFIVIGGLTGVFGIFIFLTVILVNICALNPYGIPYSAPFSPFDLRAMRDTVLRLGWKTLSKHIFKIQKVYGSDSKKAGD